MVNNSYQILTHNGDTHGNTAYRMQVRHKDDYITMSFHLARLYLTIRKLCQHKSCKTTN